ncbi:MAG: 1-acyl-sn-glycerol-3-phosphate acyltransferase [Bacteroidia bacterium]|nr:1-acyl-sn-glycerol-3-phosphate acyltransferase [Bacteroidia bacterium]MBT8268348.1 1-acyl-sn-glycerol-3-phosphate acyltransferase [Bacteroidia bacterium]NNK70625.1 acyltransferase [Flavobacteriaceae bacterium]NNL80870.1 acyltransferase [Flavobacteriaceae bacterium]
MRWLAKFIYHKILGWKVTGFNDFDSVKKCVLIAAPHTSWHDFYIGVLLRSVTGIKANFVGKKALFKWPFGWFFKAMGGTPVERKSNENQVDAIARLFNNKEVFRMALAPEGTRKKVDEWRTGFYYIAKAADVPIVMFTLDFGKKENRFSEPFYATDDQEADFKYIRAFYEGVVGKVPEYS